MTYRTTRADLRLTDPQRLGNSRGPRVQQNGIAARMKILAGPGKVLAALFPSTTMTTRGFATCGTDKLCSGLPALRWFCGQRPVITVNECKAN
jgi:hypothetical protein